MHGILESNKTEAIILVEAVNALNLINRKALIHNIEYLCPIIGTFINNCCAMSAQFFITGGKELLRLREGAT